MEKIFEVANQYMVGHRRHDIFIRCYSCDFPDAWANIGTIILQPLENVNSRKAPGKTPDEIASF